MDEPRKKTSSFGGANVAYFTPSAADANPPAPVVNVHLSFEEALKLHLSLGQALGKLNSYHRGRREGKNAGAIIRVYLKRRRIVVYEGRLKRDAAPGRPTDGSGAETAE